MKTSLYTLLMLGFLLVAGKSSAQQSIPVVQLYNGNLFTITGNTLYSNAAPVAFVNQSGYIFQNGQFVAWMGNDGSVRSVAGQLIGTWFHTSVATQTPQHKQPNYEDNQPIPNRTRTTGRGSGDKVDPNENWAW